MLLAKTCCFVCKNWEAWARELFLNEKFDHIEKCCNNNRNNLDKNHKQFRNTKPFIFLNRLQSENPYVSSQPLSFGKYYVRKGYYLPQNRSGSYLPSLSGLTGFLT